jgi:hypothetical protein
MDERVALDRLESRVAQELRLRELVQQNLNTIETAFGCKVDTLANVLELVILEPPERVSRNADGVRCPCTFRSLSPFAASSHRTKRSQRTTNGSQLILERSTMHDETSRNKTAV